MARRYGGKFSPGADNPAGLPRTGTPPVAPPMRRSRAGMRVNLLFLAPAPLVVMAFFREPVGLAFNLAAFGVLMLAAWLTREGLIAEEAYDARTVARRPAIPRKLMGSALTAVGLGVAAFGAGQGVAAALILAVLGGLLHGMAFGLDPMKDKGLEGVDSFQTDRVARAVDEAERHLAAMKDAILRANDRALTARVDRFQATARAMFRQVEQDPRDLTAARRYLGVYLLGARDATVKFADIYGRTRDPKVRADYEALLDDLEREFAARTERLLIDDRTNLDIEIEVLRERLERDGVRAR
jgi:5-bromo-4-chloroindolyl phosphate hydrolysis protein